jgi:hypothetical protein
MNEVLWRGRIVKERRAVRIRGVQMAVKGGRVAGEGEGLASGVGLAVIVVSRSSRGTAM